jgi:uncharacterized protein (TIGR02466 family)
MIKNVIPMFYTPMYVFSFERHAELKERTLKFVDNEDLYKKYSTAPHIKLSDPDLYNYEEMLPYYEFMKECYDYVMDDLGYVPKQSITSMWSTKQERGMYHHPHKHSNTFLAGVYYLHGAPITGGTSFLNPDNLLQIQPTRNLKPLRMSPMFQSQFVEGDFIVFPAWILHSTNPNMGQETRYILGSNSMPYGKTVDEVYDRFNYPNSSDIELNMNDLEYNRYTTDRGR